MRISDLVGLLEQDIATSQIQRLGFTLQKGQGLLKLKVGLRTENTVVPIIRRLAGGHHYATYVDIGAYDGDTTIPVSQLFDYCVAVEPHPKSFLRLQDNLQPHGIRNTTAVRCAIGSEIGEQVLYFAEKDDNSSLTPLDNPWQREKVKVLTLDNIVAELRVPPPYLIKIDVEGGEFHVLMSGSRTLGADCAIVSELWPYALKRACTPATSYLYLLKTRGYQPFNYRLQPISWAIASRFSQMWENKPRVATSIVFKRSNSQVDQSAIR